jgi:hypothetical protein
MKLGKEIKIKNFKDFNMCFGSVNNKQPKSFYLNISSWVEPKENSDGNYNKSIKNLNKKISQTLFNYSSKFNFERDMTIIDLDLRESGIRKGKRSFMSCEMTFYPNRHISVNSDEVKNFLTNLTQELIDKVFKQCDTFNFHKRKR